MAKKETEPKVVLEREYNVPLRREFLKTANWKRSKKASKALREFIVKHMKPETDEKGDFQVKIGKHLNEKIWEHGIRNPPHHVKIIVKKDDKGLVIAELVGAPVEETKEEAKKEVKKEEVKEEKSKEEEKKETKEEKTKSEEKKDAEKPKVSGTTESGKAEILKKEFHKEQPKMAAAPKQAVRESKIPARK